MRGNNKLYCLLLLHLFLVLDSVELVRGETSYGDSTQFLRAKYTPQEESNHVNLSQQFRDLTGNTRLLHFDQRLATSVKTAVRHFTQRALRSRIKDRGGGGGGGSARKQEGVRHRTSESGELEIVDEELEEPYPRRRLNMIVTGSSPSAIAKQGAIVSASIHQIHIAYHIMARSMRRRGRQAKNGFVLAMHSTGRFFNDVVQFTKKKSQKLVALLLVAAVNTLHFVQRGLQSLNPNKKHPSKASTSVSWPSSLAPTQTEESTPPSPTPAASSPSWSSLPSIRSHASVLTNTSPKKKAQAVSLEHLMGSSSSGNMDTPDAIMNNSPTSLEGIPKPSFLGRLFSTFMGGLLVLGSGALVGHFWSSSEWRLEGQQSSSDVFSEVDVMERSSSIPVPITPESHRY